MLLLFEQQVERPADAARWALQGEGEALRAAGREALGGLTHPVGPATPPSLTLALALTLALNP